MLTDIKTSYSDFTSSSLFSSPRSSKFCTLSEIIIPCFSESISYIWQRKKHSEVLYSDSVLVSCNLEIPKCVYLCWFPCLTYSHSWHISINCHNNLFTMLTQTVYMYLLHVLCFSVLPSLIISNNKWDLCGNTDNIFWVARARNHEKLC